MPRERANATRAAADIIDAARRGHLPLLTLSEAARRAGITPDGWRKVIKTGRGREDTLLAMARVVGTEDEVRNVLGLVPQRSPDESRFPARLDDLSQEERRWVLAHRAMGDAERRGA